MKSFDEHLADCRALATRRAAVQLPTAEAFGLRLAEPVYAREPSPRFDTSAMDGYAVRVADVPGRLPVVGDVPAGVVPAASVRPATAVRIMTGSALPIGTEAVVPVEVTKVVDGEVEVEEGTAAGRNIRRVGEDVAVGDVVLAAGERIGPAQFAALVAHNVMTVAVHPTSRVAVLSTGDELVEFGQVPGPAQLVDSNGPGLAAAARAAGADVVHVSHLGDDPDRFLSALEGLPPVELVVTSGGISMGAYDVVKLALSARGVCFETVAMQPAKPQAWGRLAGGPAFLGLPGNPVSALISFELFGRAALGCERSVSRATLTEPVARSPRGKRQFLRGWLAGGEVRPLGGPGSHLIVGLARANCLIVIAEERDQMSPGELVDVILIGD